MRLIKTLLSAKYRSATATAWRQRFKAQHLFRRFKVLITIFRLFREYKPLQFFGLFALILALFAAVLFLPVLIYYFRTGLVPRFPTLIVSCFSAVCALLSFSCGLILDSIRVKHRQLFELYLHLQEKGKKDEG